MATFDSDTILTNEFSDMLDAYIPGHCLRLAPQLRHQSEWAHLLEQLTSLPTECPPVPVTNWSGKPLPPPPPKDATDTVDIDVIANKLGSLELKKRSSSLTAGITDVLESLTLGTSSDQLDDHKGIPLNTLPSARARWCILRARQRAFAAISLSIDHPCWMSIVLSDFTPMSFPVDIAQAARKCCFWHSLKVGTVQPLVHLLCKCVNQPCQTRKFDTILKRFVRSSDMNKVLIRSVVLAALMGSYPGDVGTTQLDDHVSLRLRVIAMAHPFELDRLVARADKLTLFALRQALVWAINDDPVFRKHVSALCDWDGFGDVVAQTLANVRAYVNKLYPIWTAVPEEEPIFTSTTVDALSSICQDSHKAVLAVCYQRHMPPLLTFMHTCKRGKSGRFKIAQMEQEAPTSAVQTLGQVPAVVGDSNTQSGGDDDEKGQSPPPDETVPETGMSAMASAVAASKNVAPPPSVQPLSRRILEVLSEWISVIDPVSGSLEKDILPHCEHLGAPRAAISEMTRIVTDHDQYRLGKRPLRTRLAQYQRRFPYTFYLLQVACFMWHEHTSCITYPLPWHYGEGQLKAMQSRLGFKPEAFIACRRRMMFHFCGVCRSVCSILNAPDRRNAPGARTAPGSARWGSLALSAASALASISTVGGPSNGRGDLLLANITGSTTKGRKSSKKGGRRDRNRSSLRECEGTFGYRNVVMNYLTGTMHCKLDRRQGHVHCADNPLREVLLYGQVLVFYGQVIALCPNDGCGVAFVFHADHCQYGPSGFMCSVCSDRVVDERSLARRIVAPLESRGKTQRKCALCTTAVSETSSCFVYPHNTLLCAFHHSPHIAVAIRAQPLLRADEVVSAIRTYTAECKTMRAQLFRKRDRIILARTRRNNRTSKVPVFFGHQ